MIKRVYFMRHGDAGDKRAWEGPDTERPLSELGVARTEAAARHFVQTGFRPSKILTSPLTRALQTAEIVAAALEASKLVQIDDVLAPGFDITGFRRILKSNADQDRLLLVGHDPGLSNVIEATMGGGSIVLKKGGIARLDIDDPGVPTGHLVWLASPSSFASQGSMQESASDPAAATAADSEA
ncbi:MAG: phosphohistidine phosphatase SixA [Coriobacteriia bacterium]|nr:phosphohistidine phosphatase SixA [Coriobacteriia bacterium]